MGRVHEIGDVNGEHQARWLAAQLDELEETFLSRLDRLTAELVATRKILTGLLTAILVASLTIPIGLIWASAIK